MARDHQPDVFPIDVPIAQQLGHPAGNERGHAGVGADRRRLPQPHAAEPPIPGERLGQDDLTVVSGARQERDDRHLLRLELVEHGIESGLALVERHRDLVEEPARAQRFGQPPHQRVRARLPPRAVRGDDQRPAAHRATSCGNRSIVGSSRPVTTVRFARSPISR